ncbi:MAG: DUF3991 and toprim domain-containing protein [Streptococcaceae bacterium]|nr:DUF3991 and toprim domain-containing protein [Streptococcaceae bacterium]
MANYKSFTKEEINQATQVSILEVAENLGFHLVKTGKCYSWGDKNQYRFYPTTNSYHNFSDSLRGGGNVINFVRNETKKSFQDTVHFLLEGTFTQTQIREVPKEEFDYYFTDNPNFQIAKDYLVGQRKLDEQLIDFLYERKYIRMDKYNQVIFPWCKSGVIVGATIQGTKYDIERFGTRGRFKGIARNSESHFGFNVSIGNPDKLYIFESPIDLLSYWSLNKEIRNASFVSLDGVKPESLMNFLRYFATDKRTIFNELYICTDNDRAGIQFLHSFDDRFAKILVHNEIPDYHQIPKATEQIYHEALKRTNSKLDWRLLAAIHKEETNLSNTSELTNLNRLAFFFGQKQVGNEKSYTFSFEEMVQHTINAIQKLEEFEQQGKMPLDSLLAFNDNHTESHKYRLFQERVKSTYQAYLGSENFIASAIVKDWNEKLQNLEVRNQKWKGYYANDETNQVVHAQENKDTIQAKIYQSGQVAGQFEAESVEEMDYLIKNYGFHAIDKEDLKKYAPNSKEIKQSQNEAIETEL